jgi:threonine/homoserine/homoserine lactone efflux protein
VGIFIGILAWDLLSEGHPDLIKALMIAIPCALAWYAIRCWRHGSKKTASLNQESQSRAPGA